MYSDNEIVKINDLILNGDISGWFKSNDGGPYLQEFQHRFADFCGSKYAFAVSSGSASIYIALRALGVTAGDFVVVPSYTHVGSVAPIVLAGAIPIFCDVNGYGNLDSQDLERILDESGPDVRSKVKAIIAVHQLGQPCDVTTIRNVARNIPIVEDASHALGSTYFGKKAGTLGEIGCFSTGGGRTKTIGVGEGAMLTTNNDELAEKIKNIRNHGDRVTDAPYFCFNFRLSELNALVGLIQMKKLQFLIDWQVNNANFIIKNLPKIFSVLPDPTYSFSTRYMIGCAVDTKELRDEIIRKVKEGGYEGGVPRKNIGVGYPKLVSEIKFYSQWHRKCFFAEYLRDHSIWIDYHRYPRSREEIDDLLKFLNGLKVT